MGGSNRRLTGEEEQRAEAAWAAGHTGTSAQDYKATVARRQAEEALEAAREQLRQHRPEGMELTRALNDLEELERRLAEAIRVWQVRYLEAEAERPGWASCSTRASARRWRADSAERADRRF